MNCRESFRHCTGRLVVMTLLCVVGCASEKRAALDAERSAHGDTATVVETASPAKSAADTVASVTESQQWPGFRGRDANGIGIGRAAPTQWSRKDGTNILWTTELPGLGHSCPAIWGDRIFITTAVADNGGDEPLVVGLYGDIKPVVDETPQSWMVVCLERSSGRELWRQTAHHGVPLIQRHPKSTHANSTPATDGRHVVAFFGSEGLYCYDIDGNLLWSKQLGRLDSGYYVVPGAQWGFGSSPVIVDGVVLIQCDVQKDSFLAAYDVKDGHELWRTPRREVPTWGSPTVVTVGDTRQVLVNGHKHIGAYDFKTGAPIWWMQGGGDIPVPTPVVADDLIFITSAHGGPAPIYAIRTNAVGDITLKGEELSNAGIAWSNVRGGAYMQTPVVLDGRVFSCMDHGVLTCYRAATGDVLFRTRLGSGRTGFTASPVANGDCVYYTSEQGEVHVLRGGDALDVVAINEMDEVCMATPAIVDGVIYIRTQKHLVAIGEK